MAFSTKKAQDPGEILRLEIPLTLSIILIVAVTALTISYALWADARPTIRFLGIATGVAAGVLSAFYIGRGLKITIEQRDQALTDQKISRAFGFLRRWNDPNFAYLRKQWRALLEELEGKTDDQICEIIRSSLENRTVIADVLNFFEEMAYAARGGIADLATLKQICGTIVVRYFEAIRPWLARYRTDKHQPTAYEHFEWLSGQWKRS